MTQAQESEPPSWFRPPLFMVGQDARGNWVNRTKKGMRGAPFCQSRGSGFVTCDPRTDLSHRLWSYTWAVSNARHQSRNVGAVLRLKSASDLANRRRVA